MTMSTRGRALAAALGVAAGSIAAFVILFMFTALVMISPARAADKGGGCCADLEERVAELEATVARKGNRKMSLQVYGQINKAILWHDVGDGEIPKKRVIDGSQSPTMLGVMGEAKVSPAVKVGYRLEFEINTRAGEDTGIMVNSKSAEVSVRHSYVWLEGSVGRFSLGKTSMATDGIVEITTANTDVVAKMLSLEPLSTNYLGGFNLPFDGGRREVVRYDSPTFGGFVLSAAWSTGDNVVGFGGVNYGDKNVWDAALRYAGEFGGFRVAAGVGYRHEDRAIFLTGLQNRISSLAGSASVKHMGSGLFANVAAGRIDGEFLVAFPNTRVDFTGMHGQAGWEKNIWGIGSTTLYGEYAQLKVEGDSEKPNMLGLGLVQALDAASADLYVSWRQFDMDSGDEKVNVFMAGARVKF